MHIQVITGPAGHSKTAQLNEICANLAKAGIPARIIQATAYSDDGLLDIMEVEVSAGKRTLLADNCTRAQIHAVLAWQSDADEDSSLEDLVIHMVRMA